MKNTFLVIIISFISLATINSQNIASSSSQDNASAKVYFSGGFGFGLGTSISANASINYIHKDKYSFSIVRATVEQGFFLVIINSTIKSTSTEFLAGRIFNLTSNGTVRINLKGGLGYANSVYTSSVLFSKESTKKSTSLGVVLYPEIELPFTRNFGLSLVPEIKLFGEEFNYLGLRLNVMVGNLR